MGKRSNGVRPLLEVSWCVTAEGISQFTSPVEIRNGRLCPTEFEIDKPAIDKDLRIILVQCAGLVVIVESPVEPAYLIIGTAPVIIGVIIIWVQRNRLIKVSERLVELTGFDERVCSVKVGQGDR